MTGIHMYSQMLLNLGIVIAIIVVYFGLMHWGRRAKKGKKQTIDLISTLSLSPKEKIIIIETDKRKFLLGVTTQNISLICNLNEDEVLNVAENGVTSFKEIYNQSESEDKQKVGDPA